MAAQQNSPASSERHAFDVTARARYLPDWRMWSFLFLASDSALAGAVAAELRGRQNRSPSRRGRCAPLVLPLQTVCRPVVSTKVAISEIAAGRVLGLILDLRSHSRESLGLLRQLLRESLRPAVIAVGDESHREMTGLLLEAGCTALLVAEPFDLPIADWCQRVIRHHRGERT